MSVGKSKSKSSSSSKPLTADEVATYFSKIDELSGGRLGDYARTGTQATQYMPLTTEQIQSLGGLGATRELQTNRARAQAIQEIASDPSLSVFQKQRARQLTDRDYTDALDAIAKETEAAIGGTAERDKVRQYQSELANNALRLEDLQTLAQIFFGGRGQTSSSSSRSSDFSLGFNRPSSGGGALAGS
jgi:hypothetical protein